MKKSICLAIVDPSLLIREGLSKVINDASSLFYPLLKFESAEHFLGHNSSEGSFVLIINPVLLHGDASLIKKIKENESDSKIVALISTCVPQSLLAGFDTSINIYMSGSQITHILRNIAEPDEDVKNDSNLEQYDLSERENEILVMVAKGKTNKEIAQMFNISVHTVMSHRKNIAKKTGIKSISGLTVYAMLNGLIEN